MSVRRAAAAAAVMLCVLTGSAFGSGSASAEKIYYPGVSFGGPGSGPGQLKEPVGVAVNDSTGDVYVADEGNNRVEWFTASGTFEGQFNGSGAPTGAFSGPEQVAVDSGTGDVYVTDTGHLVIDRFSATGEYESQITGAMVCSSSAKAPPCAGGETEEFHHFTRLRGIAVNQAGDLWVYGALVPNEKEEENSPIMEFTGGGGLLRVFSSEAFSPSRDHAIAVDAHEPPEDVYVSVALEEEVSKFTAEGERLDPAGNITRRGDPAHALAVVPPTSTTESDKLANDLLVDSGSVIIRYGAFSEPYEKPVESFPGENVPEGFGGLSGSFGVAVGGSGVVYASERGAGEVESFDYVPVPVAVTEAPSGVTTTGITLHGSVNPGGETLGECFFEYGTVAGVYEAGKRAQCEPAAGTITGSQPVPVSAHLTGLGLAGVRSFRLVAVGGAGVRAVGSGGVVSHPAVAGTVVEGVGSSYATVSAQVSTGGLVTCYTVEYCVGERAGEECVAPGSEPVEVSMELVGLAVDAGCRVRVVASNALGEASGGDVVFSTVAPVVSAPPDGRGYELVSSPLVGQGVEAYVPWGMTLQGLDRNGIHGISTPLAFQTAADGEDVAYVGDPPAKGGSSSVGLESGNQYLARRGGGGGWTSVDIVPPVGGYAGFAEDLSVGVLGSSQPVGAAGAPEGYIDLYRRVLGWRQGGGGAFEAALGAFEPLITARPPCEPREFKFGKLGFGGGNAGAAAVPVFSHLLFGANAALGSTPRASGPAGCSPTEFDLYDWVGGQLRLVSVLPEGGDATSVTFGQQGPSPNGFASPDLSNVISRDGSRVFWSTVELVNPTTEPEERPTGLYVRENDVQSQSRMSGGRCTEPSRACTLRLDAPVAGVQQAGVCEVKPGECEHPVFRTASGDGSRVFFTDESRLTEGASAQLGEPDLYEYDVEAPESRRGRLSDLSLPVEHGASGDVLGVLGASEDGSYVYFVANGVLSEGANVEGGVPVKGQPNLYVRHGGVTRFIATLAASDGDFTEKNEGVDGDWQADPGHRTAEVTPDGHSVVFMSRLPLTGYDNAVRIGRGAGETETPLAEVFLYDADTGRMVCVSCAPTGAAPTDKIYPEFAQLIPGETSGVYKVWGSFLPVSESPTGYQPRLVSRSGDRVFFDSIEPLVPQATNGFLNVYEWEREGTGTCGEAPGCVYLLSGGNTPENAYLVDASAEGESVFFVSRAQLVRGAGENGYDKLYDARVGGMAPLEAARCAGSACQGSPPPPPMFATPPSATFNGPGNIPPPKPLLCPKGKRPSGGKCVRKIKKKAKKRRVHRATGTRKGAGARGRGRGARGGARR